MNVKTKTQYQNSSIDKYPIRNKAKDTSSLTRMSPVYKWIMRI